MANREQLEAAGYKVCMCDMPILATRNFQFRPKDDCPIHAEFAADWQNLDARDKRDLMLVTITKA